MSRKFAGPLRAAIVLVLGACACGALSAPALASSTSSPNPGWMLTGRTYPTALPPGGSGVIVLDVMNIGAASSSGTVTVTDTLPPGVTAEEAGALEVLGGENEHPKITISDTDWQCTGNGPGGVSGATVLRCTSGLSFTGGSGFPGTTTGPLALPVIAVRVKLPVGEATETNRASIAGGGALTSTSTADPLAITSKPLPFGFEGWHVWASNANGTLDTQAGSHPYELTFAYNLNNYFNESFYGNWSPTGLGPEQFPLESRNIEVRLPPGLVGEPGAIPECTRRELDAQECPPGSQLGVLVIVSAGGFVDEGETSVYNMVPPAGYPDELGFTFGSVAANEGIETRLDTEVRSGGDYGLTTYISNVPERDIIESVLTLWGTPGDQSHNLWRGKVLGSNDGGGCREGCGAVVTEEKNPYFTLPASCAAPPTFTIKTNTWEDPNITAERSVQLEDGNGTPTGLTGCEHLTFGPTVTTDPDTSKADTPAGLTVEVKAPVGGLKEAEGLSGADIENTTVALPRGVAINPGQAAGLEACQAAQDGLEPLPNGEEDNGPPSCPNASKVGTDEIVSPLLAKPLQGSVYVLQSNPPELKLLVAASGEGVNVKLVGVVHLDEATGQLTTTFAHTPQLPFTNFKLSFSGGAQAALATPTQCGIYGAEQGFSSDFESWASPFIGSVFPTAAFAITSGTNGAPCPPSPLPYTPRMIAGSTTDQAGGYTDFSLLLQAPDDQQRTSRLQFKTPEGLLGMISKVPLCTNAQAEANACPEASQIGHAVVASGPGPYPLVIPQPGQSPAPIYLTEGYEGAPYGLSIVVPLHVGPFVLPTQRVRAKIEVDELTSQLTVTTDPLPQYVAGVPTDLRSIDAVIDKPGFMFNPTGCTKRPFVGSAYGTEGAQTPLESPFQMGSCRALTFKPDFKASTQGKTSRAGGASLSVKLVYPTTPLGANQASSQSNVQSVKVELPKLLPSRLTTLQKACTAKQFNANPAGCPAASVVGHATAITPVLPVPLTGPAYFVSNGNESFPNLIVVLQGYGVTIHLVGDTFISSGGITSSTFKQVPDVPISLFELTLPEGPYSALAANGNLCKANLSIPTHFVAQNGAELQQSTPIDVTGCKPAIDVLHHAVSGGKATITVHVPAAGKITATGAGLSRAAAKPGAAGDVTLHLALTGSERRFLSHHPKRRLRVTVRLRFTPKHGGKLSSGVTLLMR